MPHTSHRARRRTAGSTALCSMPECSEPQRYGQRYCRECHSKYMKAWRAKRRREERELRASVVKLRSKVVEQGRELSALKSLG